jgi:site-specific DNA recombinase
MLHVFDEHQSRETAKHVSRAMCENARQGFWNGSTPPYGYMLEVKERRGNKDKKVLVPNEAEAAVVRQIFELASGASGRPMGVKNIAVHLNDRGIRRKGHRWSTGSVHVALPPFFGSPEAGVFGLLLCPHSLDHLRLEFSASCADDGLDAPPVLCS